MKLIVGLGNPGKQYDGTKHNIGFKVIDELATRWNAPLMQSKFNGAFSAIHKNGEKVILLKPLTYMNLSGECIRPMMDYYNMEAEDLVVLYDDLDLPMGSIRLRKKGSAGGHNGIKSTIAHVGTAEFNRIRIGISRPPQGTKVVDYVLSRFSDEDCTMMETVVKKSADACESWLEKPFLEVMNEFNGS
ncbi:aminoacyl-tRNA hydrolase [Jeotgalibacillus soli]|uniref:Peptidyl-tRNA hydrolase n=1 Tax=Jeotgalibacillus soli TaxID=889306 RepID=A0A0C2RQJ6_9BACL|nr:aminoacyl-tRNA hydrolase [Jeotgalibacillus soli]KIL52515.1 peptidyl-tRNA hydrolase [Jeotgalibacillus soli]